MKTAPRFLSAGLVMAALVCAVESDAQGGAPWPVYKSLRYDEDYRSARAAGGLKYIPLGGPDGAYLTLGGEIRERYEYFDASLWGDGPQDNNGYLLQRYMLHADLQISERVRFFTQLKSATVTGRVGGARATDEDRLDLNQAFADIKWSSGKNDSFTLRIGRQEIALGSSRLVSVREGPNTHLSFDGIRTIAQAGEWRVDTFAVAPVQTKPGIFDDGADPHQKLWGVYAVTPLPALPGGHVDLYYFGLERDSARFNQGRAREERHSVGFRLWGGRAGWDYNFESLDQFGTFGDGRIQAWTFASDTGYTFAQAKWRPRLSLKADIASGDRDPHEADLQSFNPLFPRGAYFNESALIGPVNFIDVHPGIELQLAPTVRLAVDWDFFWRESTRDGLYGMAGNLVRTGLTSDARYVGNQPALTLQWRATAHWSFSASAAHFFAGPFLTESGPGRDMDFLTTSVTGLF